MVYMFMDCDTYIYMCFVYLFTNSWFMKCQIKCCKRYEFQLSECVNIKYKETDKLIFSPIKI